MTQIRSVGGKTWENGDEKSYLWVPSLETASCGAHTQLTFQNLWVQCETPELRFLKCSIKWDVLTFCFSPVSASFLHSFYSLENTTPPPSPFLYILAFNFLPFLRFLWIVVFSLVITTEPYASHNASEIEPPLFGASDDHLWDLPGLVYWRYYKKIAFSVFAISSIYSMLSQMAV
jgi:hypothetical protein